MMHAWTAVRQSWGKWVAVGLMSLTVAYSAAPGRGSAQAPDPSLPDWSDAGYMGGQAIPTGGTIIDLTTKGVIANDGIDDSAALQAVIDDIRSGALTVGGSAASEHNRAILLLPAGQVDLSAFIRMDASWVTLRGAGSDPATGTKIVFKPASTYASDDGLPVIDGKLWPGYGAFMVEDRDKHPDEPNYEGSINFHWKSGVKVASGGGGTQGGTSVYLASGQGSKFHVGDTIYVGAANTEDFYNEMEAPEEYWINQHMRSQLFEVTAVSGNTLTIDKPLEFDIPYSNGGHILGTTYYSKVMKVKTVEGVGFENFYFTQDLSNTPYANKNSGDYDAVGNPNGVGLKYTNEAPEYAIHGIVFKWAQNGWVKGIRTYMTGSHPIVTEFARHMEFRDNVIFGAWNKGKGGHGYFRGSKLFDSIIANNTIDRVRHLTLQWSASGNVVTGNAMSVDMNLHGGWERNNLIERNTITIPYLHRSWGEGEGGMEPEGGTWYPIWYGAGPHASKWSGSSGYNNVIFHNTMAKQETEGGSYNTYAPYDDPNRIYQIGWDGSTWSHLQKPAGTFIDTWTYNETVDFSAAPNAGVYDCLTYTGASLLGSGTLANDCDAGSGDTEAPTAPAGLTAAAASSSRIDLNWTASSDNVGVTGYRIYRGGSLIGTTGGTNYSDTGLSASSTHSYTVTAYDAAGNESLPSNAASATTDPATGSGSGPVDFTGTVDNDGSTYKKLVVAVDAGSAAVTGMTFTIRVTKQGDEYWDNQWASGTGNFSFSHSAPGTQIVYQYDLKPNKTETGDWSFNAAYKMSGGSGATAADDTWEVTYTTSVGTYTAGGLFDGVTVNGPGDSGNGDEEEGEGDAGGSEGAGGDDPGDGNGPAACTGALSSTIAIQNEMKNAAPGDVILIAPGTYTGDVSTAGDTPRSPDNPYGPGLFYSGNSGTSAQPIMLGSCDSDHPATLSGIADDDGSYGIHLTGDYWEIRDLIVQNAQKGIIIDNGNHNLLHNVEVHQIGDEGVHFRDGSSYNALEYSKIYDTGNYQAGYGEGAYVGSDASASYEHVLIGNIIRHTLFDGGITAEHIDIKEGADGTIVEYCTFNGTGISGANSADSFIDIKGVNSIVRYNEGYRNGNSHIVDAFQVRTHGSGYATGENNVFYFNTVDLDSASGYVVYATSAAENTTAHDDTRIGGGNLYNKHVNE